MRFHVSGPSEISVKSKKGSPEGYYAETGDQGPIRKPHTGEPNERYSLYRARRTQETHQFLQQDSERIDSQRRTTVDATCGLTVIQTDGTYSPVI